MKLTSGKPDTALRPVAAALVALFGLAAQSAWAAPAVTNCDDSGDGSLRASMLAAGEGETVDATQLQCSTISLTTGFLVVAQNSLTIAGPGVDKLTIDGGYDINQYNILFHNGNGALEIDDLAMKRGNFYLNDASKYFGGGCVFSNGSITLNRTSLTYCTMSAGSDSRARGGAVYANGSLTITDSVVSGNETNGAPIGNTGYYYPTYGGALFAKGAITLTRSQLRYNLANFGGGIYSLGALSIYSSDISVNYGDSGAGIMGRSSFLLDSSTVSGNRAYHVGGILIEPKSVAGQTATVRSSTISGNTSSADGSTPGMASAVPLSVSHSTFAFNHDYSGDPDAALLVGGATLQLDTSIVAENIPRDLAISAYTTASGAKNFIDNTNVTLTGTVSGCPKLEPLRDNGGPTLTHALRPGSAAIDAGANPTFLSFDQRGMGFPRAVGVTDIGAYEWQGESPDQIFRSGFQFDATFCDWDAFLQPHA